MSKTEWESCVKKEEEKKENLWKFKTQNIWIYQNKEHFNGQNIENSNGTKHGKF